MNCAPFLVLDLGLDIVNGVGGLHLEGDGLAGEGLHEDLHTERGRCVRVWLERKTEWGMRLDNARIYTPDPADSIPEFELTHPGQSCSGAVPRPLLHWNMLEIYSIRCARPAPTRNYLPSPS